MFMKAISILKSDNISICSEWWLVLYAVTSIETAGNRKKWKTLIIYSVHVPHYEDEVFRSLTSLIIATFGLLKSSDSSWLSKLVACVKGRRFLYKIEYVCFGLPSLLGACWLLSKLGHISYVTTKICLCAGFNSFSSEDIWCRNICFIFSLKEISYFLFFHS